jgi:MYXO-CTERM domain-containing protein
MKALMRASVLLLAGMAVPTAGFASTVEVVWNSWGNNITLANPSTFTSTCVIANCGASTQITVMGYGPNNVNGSPVALYGKNLGGDEVGIGLTNDPSGKHEITNGSFIQINVGSANFATNAISFQAGSLNTFSGSNESWSIYETNTAGTLNGAQLLKSCTNTTGTNCEQLISDIGFKGGYKYLDFTTTTSPGNFLVAEIDGWVTTSSGNQGAPGPTAGAGLPGLALVGIGLFGWWRRRANAS